MKKLKRYKATKFKAKGAVYDKDAADYAVGFIECLCHTKGTWAGKPFELIDWQEQIIRDVFGTIKPNGYRQFNTAYIELVKMDDCQAPPIGTKGTVLGVDDIASIMVAWDNGSGLNVAYGEDICRKLGGGK